MGNDQVTDHLVKRIHKGSHSNPVNISTDQTHSKWISIHMCALGGTPPQGGGCVRLAFGKLGQFGGLPLHLVLCTKSNLVLCTR